jgi:hypothetical protein
MILVRAASYSLLQSAGLLLASLALSLVSNILCGVDILSTFRRKDLRESWEVLQASVLNLVSESSCEASSDGNGFNQCGIGQKVGPGIALMLLCCPNAAPELTLEVFSLMRTPPLRDADVIWTVSKCPPNRTQDSCCCPQPDGPLTSKLVQQIGNKVLLQSYCPLIQMKLGLFSCEVGDE